MGVVIAIFRDPRTNRGGVVHAGDVSTVIDLVITRGTAKNHQSIAVVVISRIETDETPAPLERIGLVPMRAKNSAHI